MKTLRLISLVLVASALAGATMASPQFRSSGTTTRGTGVSTDNGLDRTTTGVATVRREPQPPIVITFNALSELREWTNKEGKTMKARLLAFEDPQVRVKGEAPAEEKEKDKDKDKEPQNQKPETGVEAEAKNSAAAATGKAPRFVVIHEEKVRFLLENSSRPIDYPVADLDPEDQALIFRIADAVKHEASPPPKVVEEKEVSPAR